MSAFRRKHFHKRPVRREDEEDQKDQVAPLPPPPVAEPPEEETTPPILQPLPSPPTAPVSSAAPAKKKKKKKKTQIVPPPVSAKAQEAESIAAAVLKKNLKQRLHARLKMKATARAGGTSQDVQNILEKFNDNDEEKADMMREIQKDVQGMRQKDAKKYLKKVLGTMGKEDTETFVDMVKDKVPSNHSSNIVNYVKRHRTIQESDDKKKPQVNPETVYVPTRLMSEEAKAERLAQVPAPKKKKTFGRVNIQVPKLAELRDHPGVSTEPAAVTTPAPVKPDKTTKKKKKGFAPTVPRVVDVATPAPALEPVPGVPRPRRTGDRAQEIEQLFPDVSRHTREEQEAARLTYMQRIKNVSTFDPTKMGAHMRQFMFEASSVVEILEVRQVDFLVVPEAMEVPDSHQVITEADLPESLRERLPAGEQRVTCDSTNLWIYKRTTLTPGSSELVLLKARNAYPECAQFLTRLEKVRTWIASLQGQKIPWQWFCGVLNDLGILRQKPDQPLPVPQPTTWSECFRVLCHEYRSETKKMSVPIVPFVKITLSC